MALGLLLRAILRALGRGPKAPPVPHTPPPPAHEGDPAWQAMVRMTIGAIYAEDHRPPPTADEDAYLYEQAHQPPRGQGWTADEIRAYVQALPRPVVVTSRPLIGPLRVRDKIFVDDTGPRRVFFCSWFPALRILRDDPRGFEQQLNAIAAAGYQGLRIFLAVGIWDDFWNGREVCPLAVPKWIATHPFNPLRPERVTRVLPAWPDYDDLLRTLLRMCRQRRLRLHVTFGDMQGIAPDAEREIALHQRCARIVKDEGAADVVSLWEIWNEYWQNNARGRGPAATKQAGNVIAAVTAILPHVLTCQGSLNSQEPRDLAESATHGDVCAIHGTRQPAETAVRHAMSLVYWERNPYRGFPKPFWHGEPTGPDGTHKEVYQPMNARDWLVALYAMHAVTGQGSVFFNGPSVRYREPLEATWGFRELPALLAVIPEDVGTWDVAAAPGGAMAYWVKGRRFATVFVPGWMPTPPRPIAEWEIVGPTGRERGTGALPPLTAPRLIVGTFHA